MQHNSPKQHNFGENYNKREKRKLLRAKTRLQTVPGPGLIVN